MDSLPRLSGRFAVIDRYLRRSENGPARVIARLSRECGEAYAASRVKRALDLSIALPGALLSLPVVVVLAATNVALEPGEPPFFRQARVGHGGRDLSILKIRSMPTRLLVTAPLFSVGARYRRFMRRHYLDELPQLWQVVDGTLSLIGIRILPPDVYDGLARTWSPRRFARWRAAYEHAPLGLSGIHQVFRVGGKQDTRRFHRDVFYARHASLGLDLYIIWRTLVSLMATSRSRGASRVGSEPPAKPHGLRQ